MNNPQEDPRLPPAPPMEEPPLPDYYEPNPEETPKSEPKKCFKK